MVARTEAVKTMGTKKESEQQLEHLGTVASEIGNFVDIKAIRRFNANHHKHGQFLFFCHLNVT